MVEINEVSASVVYPKIQLYMKCILVTVCIYTAYFALDFIAQVCSNFEIFKRSRKHVQFVENAQRLVDKIFPCIVFSILNLIYYGNYTFCTVLTFLITATAILRYIFEQKLDTKHILNSERFIFVCVALQFGIFVFTNQDRL